MENVRQGKPLEIISKAICISMPLDAVRCTFAIPSQPQSHRQILRMETITGKEGRWSLTKTPPALCFRRYGSNERSCRPLCLYMGGGPPIYAHGKTLASQTYTAELDTTSLLPPIRSPGDRIHRKNP